MSQSANVPREVIRRKRASAVQFHVCLHLQCVRAYHGEQWAMSRILSGTSNNGANEEAARQICPAQVNRMRRITSAVENKTNLQTIHRRTRPSALAKEVLAAYTSPKRVSSAPVPIYSYIIRVSAPEQLTSSHTTFASPVRDRRYRYSPSVAIDADPGKQGTRLSVCLSISLAEELSTEDASRTSLHSVS